MAFERETSNNHEVQEKRKGKITRYKKTAWLWVKTILIVVLIVTVVRAFMFTNYIVYGRSMMPTIHNGERIIVNKIGYELFEPDRFDLVIFHANESSDYIKRIVGLPGEHIKYEDDKLYVNGEPMEEDFLDDYRAEFDFDTFTKDFTLEDVTDYETIPEGMVFVLGDNRVNSTDSRHIGLVDIDEIVGEANFSYWPPRNIRMFK